jgi:hypothetical protein
VSRLGISVLTLLTLLAACSQPPPAVVVTDPDRTGRTGVSAERYDRDRELCRVQIAEQTRTRRNIDDSRREVYSGNYDRFGQGDLPRDMANYGDLRTTDRLVANCMEARGWPQQPQPRTWIPLPKFGI